MPVTVLVVEDEIKLRELLRGYLEREGFVVISTESGAEALKVARSVDPDLILLDLRLPDIVGEEVAMELRTFTETPIVMLTAKAADVDRIRGLETGADDYVTKPFSPRELVLRCHAILRRTRTQPASARRASFGNGELVIDEDRREITIRGDVMALTPTEWGLLLALASTPGRVYSRFELMNRVRGYEYESYERTIDSHVKNLRRKVELNPHAPLILDTVVGGGYRFCLGRDD